MCCFVINSFFLLFYYVPQVFCYGTAQYSICKTVKKKNQDNPFNFNSARSCKVLGEKARYSKLNINSFSGDKCNEINSFCTL